MESQVVKSEGQSLAPMSATDVVGQVRLVQEIMKSVMKKDEHYGVIPGCGDKPTLLKPGAEKLLLTFRMAPEYVIERTDLPGNHREYEVTCNLYSIPGHVFLGSGVGICSTMESKWRYRNKFEVLEEVIPDDYKQNKNAYKEKGFVCRKIEGQWKWCKQEKLEHDNPSDNYNTVKKMGKKRALVDAAISATAASDIFTQDLEDLKANGVIVDAEVVDPSKDTTTERTDDQPGTSAKKGRSVQEHLDSIAAHFKLFAGAYGPDRASTELINASEFENKKGELIQGFDSLGSINAWLKRKKNPAEAGPRAKVICHIIEDSWKKVMDEEPKEGV